ncbi:MAG: response regulator with CheY-like receiver domain and winged-helix DNA-binding domain [Clostridiales bacterium]|nr:response regulator with CheY-like receiver domain and winged-helix DNA-binding domain [Clostridiales bacterium]
MDKPNVLVVDDDKEIVESTAIFLANEGYNILKAYDGIEALEIVNREAVHLIILDIMMPRLDGIRATLKIREQQNIPIIIISAKSQDTDKILGLNIGADDYVTKPFNPLELMARVKSQLRRYMSLGNIVEKPSQITTGGLSIDTESKIVTVDGEQVKLTATEYGIIELLISNLNRVFSINEIYERIWKEPGFNAENTVAVHIRRIREKIEINPKEPKYLKVVWGIGYKIEKI